MNTFNKKSLYLAIAGVSALGVAGSANAVHVNPDGLGQVLIYPYYTVRTNTLGAFNSLLSVTNSTASSKAVKVRFLEGKDSREVLDFNLYLSAHDIWTAAVVPTATGAAVLTYDNSCTTPKFTAGAPVAFVNFQYSGTNADGADASLDRTREGYVEIIEMGNIITDSTTDVGVTHVDGVPPCTALGDATAAANTVLGDGGLYGSMTIINVNSSAETGIDAVALESFNNAGSLWAIPSSVNPTLQDANPFQAELYLGGAVVTATFLNGIDAVSASLMHANVLNDYILDVGTKSQTDWVVTYPTKRYYVAKGTGPATKLFQSNFTPTGSCDDILIAIYDREEASPAGPSPGFSPNPPGAQGPALCWEANIISFFQNPPGPAPTVSKVFSSVNMNALPVVAEDGWANLDLVAGKIGLVHHLVSTTGQTFNGLPVVGFMTNTYVNGAIPNPAGGTLQSAYGASFKHKTTSPIAVIAP